jgi:hypothetical protein
MRLVQVEKQYLKTQRQKINTKYLSFGFININFNGEERLQYLLCMKTSAAYSMEQKMKAVSKIFI